MSMKLVEKATKNTLERRAKHAYSSDLPSMTKQADKDRCCVNKIVAGAIKNGVITHVKSATGKYGDFTSASSFTDALNVVVRAQQSFDELPADFRKKMDNDPAVFLEFVADPANKEELYKLGIILTNPVEEASSAPPKADEEASSTPPKEEKA